MPCVGMDVEKLKPLLIANGNIELGNHFGKEFGNFFQNLNINLLFNPEIPILRLSKKNKNISS